MGGFSAPSRHIESGVDPGKEVGMDQGGFSRSSVECRSQLLLWEKVQDGFSEGKTPARGESKA